ncbi:hypothetical protein FRZ67_06040 [Panacibacter ginsenosidivorans]|uniref:Uncharacterized protein n=1 Tax=Panacibacter ginsenosidivorans TaxID=1813871 RepID=A0A5B8V7I5_9BACT|nr:hypothetical protein [Panacibacter ginsenosidivorans]QEC66883.1 hypothetical protein FRZ67_06040 [Panacibacter ginsenosidivorans]
MTLFSPLLIFILVRFIFIIVKAMEDSARTRNGYYNPAKRRYKMNFRFCRKINSLSMLFNGHYIDAKALYVLQTGKVPCITFVGELDIEKAFGYIKETFKDDVKQVYHHSYFDHDKNENFFNSIILIMPNQRMIELGNNYCHLLYHVDDHQWMRNICEVFKDFRLPGNANATTKVVGFARQAEMN